MSDGGAADRGEVEAGRTRPGGGTFRSLRLRNFRIYFLGMLVSNLGAWMQATALGWTVLTELTAGDAGAMGVNTALNFLPSVLLIGVTGRFVDRFDRRTALMITASTLALVSLTIGTLLVLHLMTLPLMFCLTTVAGVAVAFDNPFRQAFVSDLVHGDQVVNAVSLSSVVFNMARLAGPALAGVLIAVVDSGWVFMINSVAFLALIVALLLIRKGELVPRLATPDAGRMRAAFSYVRRRPDLMLLFALVFVSSAFAVQFPVYGAAMSVEFHEPSWAFGLLTSCYAVGSLTGALLVARQQTARLRRIVAFASLVGVAVLVSAGMPDFWLYAAMSALIGYAIVTEMANANAYMQTHTDRAVRGRLLVIYLAFFTGGSPFGAPLIGWAANAWGARGAVVMVGIAALVSALVGFAWYLGTGRIRRSAAARLGVIVDATRPIPIQSVGGD